MKAREILEQAMLTLDERGKTHGDVRELFATVANLWTEYIGRGISAQEVACMMVLLKIARTLHGSNNPDDWLDAVGYCALGGELAEEEDS